MIAALIVFLLWPTLFQPPEMRSDPEYGYDHHNPVVLIVPRGTIYPPPIEPPLPPPTQ